MNNLLKQFVNRNYGLFAMPKIHHKRKPQCNKNMFKCTRLKPVLKISQYSFLKNIADEQSPYPVMLYNQET